jgi:hypothetical protein
LFLKTKLQHFNSNIQIKKKQMSNFYTSSPGLNKSQKYGGLNSQPAPIQTIDLEKKGDVSNFDNEDPNYSNLQANQLEGNQTYPAGPLGTQSLFSPGHQPMNPSQNNQNQPIYQQGPTNPQVTQLMYNPNQQGVYPNQNQTYPNQPIPQGGYNFPQGQQTQGTIPQKPPPTLQEDISKLINIFKGCDIVLGL